MKRAITFTCFLIIFLIAFLSFAEEPNSSSDSLREELAKPQKPEKRLELSLEYSKHLAYKGKYGRALDYINDNMNHIDKNKKYYIHCAGGYRSVIAISILKARGFDNLIDIAGGFAAIKNSGLPITNYVCPSTL